MKRTATAGLFLALALTPRAWAQVWYVDASVGYYGDGRTWETAFKSIQEAVDRAGTEDRIFVAEGTYFENVQLNGYNITLTSKNPYDPAVIAATVIDGRLMRPAVTFAGTEDETCLLSGFTIQNGRCFYGGGILGRPRDLRTHATIEKNVIVSNETRPYGAGGGLAFCDGIIRNNVICDNHAPRSSYYPGRACGAPAGGGLFDCDGLIEHNIISYNSAICPYEMPVPTGGGGGLAGCDGTIQYNVIYWNHSDKGGGLGGCDGIVQGNVIYRNWAIDDGGGLSSCNGTVSSNVIFGNMANPEQIPWRPGRGGGLRACRGQIRNNIIWSNNPGGDLSECSTPTYSCIQGWTGGGEGNIPDDPQFVDPDGADNKLWTHEDNDFRLLPDSPCIDAMVNDPDVPETDIAGMHRIMFGGKSLTVDMGAYEFYINDLKPGPTPEQTTFIWSSLADKTYSIFYSADLLTWHLAIAAFPSAGDRTTSWTDDGSLTGLPPLLAPLRFYRLVENP